LNKIDNGLSTRANVQIYLNNEIGMRKNAYLA